MGAPPTRRTTTPQDQVGKPRSCYAIPKKIENNKCGISGLRKPDLVLAKLKIMEKYIKCGPSGTIGKRDLVLACLK